MSQSTGPLAGYRVVELAGIGPRPAPAPRFGRTPAAVRRGVALPGEHTDEVLADWVGRSPGAVQALRDAGAVA